MKILTKIISGEYDVLINDDGICYIGNDILPMPEVIDYPCGEQGSIMTLDVRVTLATLYGKAPHRIEGVDRSHNLKIMCHLCDIIDESCKTHQMAKRPKPIEKVVQIVDDYILPPNYDHYLKPEEKKRRNHARHMRLISRNW
jgi:hypothetical protein